MGDCTRCTHCTRCTDARRTPHEIALLRDGPRAAVTVAVVALHLRGILEAGPPGTLRASRPTENSDAEHPLPTLPPLPPLGVPLDPPTSDGTGPAEPAEPADTAHRALILESAVHGALDEPTGLGGLVRHPEVRRAVAEVRVGLAEAGLLTYPLFRPTRAARRQVRALREQHPLPAVRGGLTPDDTLLAVALHGEQGLRVFVPRFAPRAGLTARVKIGNKSMLRPPRSSGTYGGSGGYHYCGGGGGGGCGGGM
ncbi:TIGR04222 domain-containing membrane protein [Streptomyces sp. NPDC005774]|uniref:TIGR04222 domain-containing membrane protein n=1 Tax=Streptomyces sp. NPDC005774 TaxID=3364728 RepID=UPI0036C462A7